MADIATLFMYILFFITLYFEIFLLVTFFEKNDEEEKAERHIRQVKELYAPNVAIFVPCFNEEKTLARTVQSLLALDYPRGRYEVVIVNDGSTDSTARVADSFAAHPQVTVLHKQNGGKHSALNLALEHTDAEIVGALDADSFAAPDALTKLVQKFIKPDVKAVTGAIKVHEPEGILQGMQKEEYVLGIFFRRVYSFLRAQYVTPGPLSLYRRDVIEEVGPFREAHNTEDMEMAMRIQNAGYHIDNVPDAYIYTRVPKTFKALVRQRVRWTYGFIKNAIDHKHLFFSRQHGNLGFLVLPSVFVSIMGGLYALFFATVRVVNAASNKYVQIQAIGVESSFALPSFDLFFLNTHVGIFLTIALVALTTLLLFIAKSLAQEKEKLTPSVLYYLVLFGFLAPVWVTKATFDALRSKQSSWTAEKMSEER